MTDTNVFVEFPKIARLSRGTVVTEKIDGTNAQIFIEDAEGKIATLPNVVPVAMQMHGRTITRVLRAGSRNRWIDPTDDNFGFARWMFDHANELAQLGPGRHYGEWWGSGIQRAYGLKNGDKRFSLFNVGRWRASPPPACCSIVPVLHEGDFDMAAITSCLDMLRTFGSKAAPGFMQPEGVVVFHAASRTLFKKTILKDESPKGQTES